jgi:sec-independent protein translocase protein TatC
MSSQVEDRVKQFSEEQEVRMTFGEHIEELRGRLFKSILCLLVAIVVSMVFYKDLVDFILRPHFWAMEKLNVPAENRRPISGSYGAPIIATMKLAFIVSLFVSSPVIGYQLWAFISAGLYKHERKWVVRFAPVSFFLFTAGCAFGYFVLVPYCLYGLSRSMDPKLIAPTVNFSEYLSLIMMLTIILGGVFQIPLLMVFFSKLGLVQPKTYNKWRKSAIIANVVFAAVVTPADIFTMTIVALPMLLLYEIGVVCSYLAAPRKPRPAAA